METIEGVTLHGESFSMDNKKFIDCTFIDCIIEYGGKAVILQRTAIVGCKFVFSEEARMTLEFLDCVGLLSASDWRRQGENCFVH